MVSVSLKKIQIQLHQCPAREPSLHEARLQTEDNRLPPLQNPSCFNRSKSCKTCRYRCPCCTGRPAREHSDLTSITQQHGLPRNQTYTSSGSCTRAEPPSCPAPGSLASPFSSFLLNRSNKRCVHLAEPLLWHLRAASTARGAESCFPKLHTAAGKEQHPFRKAEKWVAGCEPPSSPPKPGEAAGWEQDLAMPCKPWLAGHAEGR